MRRIISEPKKMNPDTLVAVSAYAGDKHQVENNLPLLLHHGCPVVVLSPSDAPITAVNEPTVHCIWEGLKGWIGPQTLERHVIFLRTLLRFPQQFFLFHDADSINLSPRIPDYLYQEPGTFWSNIVQDTNPGPSLLPKVAMQPPYFLSRQVIEAQLSVVGNLPTSYYGTPVNPDGWPMPFPTECIDHFVLQLAHGSGLPYKTFPDGASFETASPQGLKAMAAQVRSGKILVHSVKTKAVLDRLRVEHRNFCRAHS